MLALYLVTSIAVFGALAVTWLFPVLGWWLCRASRLSAGLPSARPKDRQVRSLAIVIPAHNEQAVIGPTLQSILEAVTYAQANQPGLSVKVMVGADACHDGTAAIAEAQSIGVLNFSENQGKWRTLTALVHACADAEVLVLADCGVLWPKELLTTICLEFSDPEVMGVAPSYANPAAGMVEEVLWDLERHLKGLEGRAGGPVSVHGASVAYDAAQLLPALEALGEPQWLNDDVVIPLVMRLQNMHRRIVYLPKTRVCDQPQAGLSGNSADGEYGRRRRMVQGNLQWITGILPQAWSRNRVAGVLALRRMARLLWAYWLMCLMASALRLGTGSWWGALGVGTALFTVLAIALILLPSTSRLGRLLRLWGAARASLSTPWYLFQTGRHSGAVSWR